MPLLPSALPPKGEARRYVANDFLNLITLLLARRPASWESSRHFRFLGSSCYNVKKMLIIRDNDAISVLGKYITRRRGLDGS